MSTPIEQNTTDLQNILNAVNELPNAGGGGGECNCSEWETIYEAVISEEISELVITTDKNGEPFNLDEVKALIEVPAVEGRTAYTNYFGFNQTDGGYGNYKISDTQVWRAVIEYSRALGTTTLWLYQYGTSIYTSRCGVWPNNKDGNGLQKQCAANVIHIYGNIEAGTIIRVIGKRVSE